MTKAANDVPVEKVFTFIQAKQQVRATACAHLDLDAYDTRSELEGLEQIWTDSLAVLTDPATGDIRAAVCFEWEDDDSCAWMYGPWVDGAYDDDVARVVQKACRALGCAEVRGFFPVENEKVLAGLDRSGWTRSGKLHVTCSRRSGGEVPCRPESLRAGQAADRPWVDELHRSLFDGGYLSAEEMTAEQRSTLVDADRAGYITYVVQADGVGYIDYLGVDPSRRRRGLGRTLLRGALADLAACPFVRLTTAADNRAALQLFASEGFDDRVELVGNRWTP